MPLRNLGHIALAAALAAMLATSACGDGEASDDAAGSDGDPASSGAPATTVPPPTIRPGETTTTTTTAPATTTLQKPAESIATSTTVAIELAGSGTGTPPPPENLKCLAGKAEGELLIEWDAPEDDINVNRVRLYVSVDGGPFTTNRNISLEDIDTTRAGGTRWAAKVTSLPADKPLRIAVTTFNAIGKESAWNPIDAHYIGAGEACGSGVISTTTVPTTCTAGCE